MVALGGGRGFVAFLVQRSPSHAHAIKSRCFPIDVGGGSCPPHPPFMPEDRTRTVLSALCITETCYVLQKRGKDRATRAPGQCTRWVIRTLRSRLALT